MNKSNAIPSDSYTSIGDIIDSSDRSKINSSVYSTLMSRLGSKTGTVRTIDSGTPIVFTMAGRDWQVVYRDPNNSDIITVWMSDYYTTASFGSNYYYSSSSIRSEVTNYFNTQASTYPVLNTITASPNSMSSSYKTAQDTNGSYGGKKSIGGEISSYGDKFWLPSLYETFSYWGLYDTDMLGSRYDSWGSWLRSGFGAGDDEYVLVVSPTPDVQFIYVGGGHGVRPACHLSLSAMAATLSSTVSLDQQGGNGGTISVTATYGSAMPSITIPTRTGYTFGGYYTGTNGSGTQYYNASGVGTQNWNISGDTTLYAKWAANSYYVSYNGNGATSGSMSNSTHTYDTAKALTTNAYSRTGYTFKGWDTSSAGTNIVYQDGASVSNLTTTNGGTITLYAVWKINTYTISTSVTPIGSGSISGGGTYNYNTTVTITATPTSNYIFLYWEIDGVISGTSPTLSFNATANKNIVAHFKLAKTYSYSTAGGEIRLIGNDFQGGTTSTTATYKAVPYAGYYLIGWSVNGEVYKPSGTIYKEQTLTLSKADSQGYGICAIFSTDANATPTPSYDLNAGTAISAQLGGEARAVGCDLSTLADTDTITYIAVTDLGYKFDGWYIDGEKVSENLSCRLTKTQVLGKIVEARFSPVGSNINDITNNTDEFL